MLSKTQFDVLDSCRKTPRTPQRSIANDTGLSLGLVNGILRELRNMGLVTDDNAISDLGMEALAPFKVENAIIMAAGLSSRFAPISFEKPKGVLTVRGEVLIERQIRQLQEAGITDITVVVGYKKEEFFYLEDLFDVDIVVNPHFAVRNNNSTIKIVEDRLSNTFICSSDDYFTENPFEPYVYEAYYAAVFEEGETAEWCLTTKGKNHRIVDVTIGGSDAWVMLGHVYWDRRFSQAFTRILDEIYESPETAGKLWEEIYVEHIGDLPMLMRPYSHGIIWEFDSLAELREFDPEFIENVDSSIMDNICKVLGCKRSDIQDIVPIKQGATNLSCRFEVKGAAYVYRHPGTGTERLINRATEAQNEQIALELGIDNTFIYEDPSLGWKISRYVEGSLDLDYYDLAQISKAMGLIRRLHDSEKTSSPIFNLHDEVLRLEGMLKQLNEYSAFRDYQELRELAFEAYETANAHGTRQCLCHNNLDATNFLVTPHSMDIIDWEYSGISDYASDLGTLICCAPEYTFDDAIDALTMYFGRPLTHDEIVHCAGHIAMASFYWFVWALYEHACGESTGYDMRLWYRNVKIYGKKTLELAEQC